MLNNLKKYLSVNRRIVLERFDSGKAFANIYDENNPRGNSQLTSLDIINHESGKTYFKSFSANGFTMSNNFKIIGACVALPKTVMFWNMVDIKDVTEESLDLLSILEPKIDILIIGKGPRNAKPNYLLLNQIAKNLKLNLEILPTAEALSTFNFLNYEDRSVAAFILPARSFNYHEEDQKEIMELRAKRIQFFKERDMGLMSDIDNVDFANVSIEQIPRLNNDRISQAVDGIIENSKSTVKSEIESNNKDGQQITEK